MTNDGSFLFAEIRLDFPRTFTSESCSEDILLSFVKYSLDKKWECLNRRNGRWIRMALIYTGDQAVIWSNFSPALRFNANLLRRNLREKCRFGRDSRKALLFSSTTFHCWLTVDEIVNRMESTGMNLLQFSSLRGGLEDKRAKIDHFSFGRS